jgi:hypothetical protein
MQCRIIASDSEALSEILLGTSEKGIHAIYGNSSMQILSND